MTWALPIKQFLLEEYWQCCFALWDVQSCLLWGWLKPARSLSCLPLWLARSSSPPPHSPVMSGRLYSISYFYLTWSQLHWFQKREKGLSCFLWLQAGLLKWLIIPRDYSLKIKFFSFGLTCTGSLILTLGLRTGQHPLFSHESRDVTKGGLILLPSGLLETRSPLETLWCRAVEGFLTGESPLLGWPSLWVPDLQLSFSTAIPKQEYCYFEYFMTSVEKTYLKQESCSWMERCCRMSPRYKWQTPLCSAVLTLGFPVQLQTSGYLPSCCCKG